MLFHNQCQVTTARFNNFRTETATKHLRHLELYYIFFAVGGGKRKFRLTMVNGFYTTSWR